MLISDKLLFLELQKTGSSHIRKVLSEVLKGRYRMTNQHNTYDSIDKEVLGNFENKVKLGSIRNPWDWYVSEWSFGCMHKGHLYKYTTNNYNLRTLYGFKSLLHKIYYRKIFQDTKIWKQVFSDVNNVENFRRWLHLILLDDKIGVGEQYKESVISKQVGFLTFRYIKLFTYNGRHVVKSLKTFEDLLHHDNTQNFMNVVVKNENIHEELIQQADTLFLDKQKLNEVIEKYKQKRTNSSERSSTYQPYYDEKSRKLVADKERFIINKYNYEF